jgi:trimethylamine:corrinoid methyltransferase-like protein
MRANQGAKDQAVPHLKLLSSGQVEAIQETALRILSEIGVKIHNEESFRILADTPGVTAHRESNVVQMSHYSVYGRDRTRSVTFGQGQLIFKSTPADPFWADAETKTWREATIADTRQAIDIGDALPNIDIVGAMVGALHPHDGRTCEAN